jgi:hypothetical protein
MSEFTEQEYYVLACPDGDVIVEQLVYGFVHKSNLFAYKITFDLQLDCELVDIDHLPTQHKVHSFIHKGKNTIDLAEYTIKSLLRIIPTDYLKTKDPFNQGFLSFLHDSFTLMKLK